MKTNGKKQSTMLEKGQVLVIVGLTIMMLMAIIGLAVDTGYVYVSYSRLRRAVDAAALAATGEFKRGYTITGMTASAMQQLRLNGVVTESDPTNNPDVAITIETCAQTANDPVLCPKLGETAKKLVRIRVTQNVPMFFLSAWGFARVPITIESISQAASIDLVLVIQNSESMTYEINEWSNRDPEICNPNGCHPLEEVKDAAKLFVNSLMYFPYDRVALVSYNRIATLVLPLSDEDGVDTITPAVTSLQVFSPQKCLYGQQGFQALPNPKGVPISPYIDDPQEPCRFYNDPPSSPTPGDGLYVGYFHCPMFFGTSDSLGLVGIPDNDASWCGTTNPAAGLVMAGNHLQGVYPNGWTGEVREDSVWVVLLLAGGPPNSAQDDESKPICPKSSLGPTLNRPGCRDIDVTVRHCFKEDDEVCMRAEHEIVREGDGAKFTMKSIYDPTNYDAYDRAFDMVDTQVANGVYIFTIGLGDLVKAKPNNNDVNNLPPGEVFLQYAAKVGGGLYRHTPKSDALKAIFLEIANKIATKLTQ